MIRILPDDSVVGTEVCRPYQIWLYILMYTIFMTKKIITEKTSDYLENLIYEIPIETKTNGKK